MSKHYVADADHKYLARLILNNLNNSTLTALLKLSLRNDAMLKCREMELWKIFSGSDIPDRNAPEIISMNMQLVFSFPIRAPATFSAKFADDKASMLISCALAWVTDVATCI